MYIYIKHPHKKVQKYIYKLLTIKVAQSDFENINEIQCSYLLAFHFIHLIPANSEQTQLVNK